MKIAFTHNLKQSDSEAEAEFDTPETVQGIVDSLIRLGHQVEPIEVGVPPSLCIAKLEALNPDLVFNTAEGRFGRYREAFFPGIFEQLGIPFTGSDAYVCTLTLDKDLTKRVVRSGGVPVPRSRLALQVKDAEHTGLRFPLILKPNYEGSSKGITRDSIVRTAEELKVKIRTALQSFPAGILIEEFIEGKDVAVAWIDGTSPATGGILPPIEYVFKTDNGRYDPFQIYDYNLKNHESDKVDLRVPASLPEDVKEKLMSFSRWAYKEISVRDLGRMDFRVTPDDEIFFIEVNALPSLEAGAGIYQAAALAGLKSMDAVLDAVIESASRRYNIKARKQSRRLERKLRVGFTYNEKRIIPGPDTDTDQEVEFDSPKTLGAIREAIASFGHEVIDLEATPDLPHLLTISDVDVVFNVAEGIRGRNREAQVPAILELMDIPHTGSDAATMALTLDKALAKRVVREAGLLTPKFFLMTSGRERVPADMPFPLIVKPVAEGSSKGVIRKSVVHNDAELRELAAEIIKRYGQAALAEEFLPGREFTVALLGERRPRALPPMEIIFTDKGAKFPVYTYQHKLEACREIRYQAPAQIDEKLREELERMARKSFAALGCRDVARIDFRLDGEGRVHFMECNPLPGLTPGWSDLCLIADSVKMDYRNLIGEILTPAIRRFKEKKKLLLQAEHHDDRTEAGTALSHP